MAFNVQCWGRVSSSGNLDIVTLQSGAIVGAPAMYTYISITDTVATIAAADYFATQAPVLNVGDFINAVGSDTEIALSVAGVTLGPPASVITVQSTSVGDVDGPAVSTDNAIVRFDGATGKIIQNSVAILDDTGNATGFLSITNGSGLIATPSWTFTGDTDTGMWRSGANTLDFSTNALRAFQIGAAPAVSVNYLIVTPQATNGANNALQPKIQAAGTDASIDVAVAGRGAAGGFAILPSSTGAAAFLKLWNGAGTFYNTFNAAVYAGNVNYTLPIAAPTANGQVLSSTTAGVTSWVNNAVGTWIDQTATPVTMVANTSYSANNAGLVTLNMPATATFGDMFEIAGQGSGGWLLQAAGGQTINFGSSPTTVAGSLASTNRYDCVKLVCTVANTTFSVISSIGNLTVA